MVLVQVLTKPTRTLGQLTPRGTLARLAQHQNPRPKASILHLTELTASSLSRGFAQSIENEQMISITLIEGGGVIF